MKTLHTIYTNFAKRFAVVLTILLTISINNVWAAETTTEYVFKSTASVSNNQITTDGVTWSITSETGKGSPDMDGENFNNQSALRIGNGSQNYYSKVTLSTSAFSSYRVSKVVVFICSNNGGSKTITAKQGDITIGSTKQNFSSTTWVNNITLNSNQGNGGNLSIDISNDATAIYIHSIKVTYSESYNVDWIINPNEGGTLSPTSGTSTTVELNSGYTYSDNVYTIISGAAEVSQIGDVFTAIPTSNTTIQINVMEIVPYTVNWYVDGNIIHTQTDNLGETLTEIPNLDDYDECDGKVFVGWITTPTYSPLQDIITNTTGMTIPYGGANYYALFAEPINNGVFVERATGTFKLYAIVNGNNYYAGTGINNRKLTSTTAIANAGDYTITHISNDQYTIQYGNQYISHANGGVDLQYLEYNDANQPKCHWTITRTGTKGTWRVASPVDNDRALVFTTANDNSNVFKAYATSNITADGAYYDLEIGNGEAISYQNYTTTCTTEVTVTLNPNGGTGDFDGWYDEVDGNYTQTVEKGNYVILPTLNDQTAYTFGGWSDGTTTHSAGTYIPEADVELTAVWTAKNLINYRTLCEYNIEYTNLEGATHNNPDTYTATNLPLEFAAPTSTREGYTFNGWSPSILSAETRGDQVVEAQWSVNQYTVTWKLNGGQWQGGGTDDRVNNHNYGEEVTRPVDPSRTGYTFTGWSPAEIPETMPAENLKFTAQWTPTSYTVTWKIGEEEYATSTVNIENPLSTAPENPSDGELGCCADKFMGWSSQQSPSAGDIFTKDNIPSNVTTAKTYYAVFATTAQGVGTSIADFSEMGYENGTAVTDPIVLGDGEGHGDATITLAKAQSSSNAPTYYTDGEAVRIYAGGTITIASSYHIKNVAFTFAAGDGSNEITANSGTYADGVWTENVESPTNDLILTIGGEAGQHRRIASITVTTGVSGSQYTNYVTQCTTLPNPALSGGSVSNIAVKCGDFSAMNNSPAITFATMQNLTCPVTFEVTEGDFLISTAQDRAAQYQSKIIVRPTKTGDNAGKLKNVYVRANATDHNENFTGIIKVTSDEIKDDVIIDLTATVTCDKFTLTTVDHLGNETVFGTYFAGSVIEEQPTPAEDPCTAGYAFVGWSTTQVEYGSIAYSQVTFPYTMPADNVTLYPVYRLVEDVSEADYHRVTYDLGADNWAGDYLIAASSIIVADGRTSNLTQINNANIDENIVPASFGDLYYVSLIAVEGGYVLKTQENKNNEKPYVYITPAGTSTTTNANLTTADNNPLSVTYISGSEILITNPQNTSGYALEFYSTKFGFYKAGAKIYLYKKSPLYTSSLICEEITADNAMVTSTAGQTVKVNVTATMSGMTISRDRTLTVERDNTNFDATITPTATENEYNVAVSYTPSAEDNKDGTEIATITIKVNNNPVNTFQVTGRHLPENFVIAAKWGDNWYAMPANCVNSGDSKQGILIDVDDINNPTSATAPTTTKYGLRGVKPGRQADFGQSILFTERVSGNQKALYQNNGANDNIWVYAQYDNYNESNPTYYEWIPTTNDLINYTFTHSASSRKLGINENGVFGAYTTDVQVRLLPATFYDQASVQIIKWKEQSVIVMYTGAATTATTQVGTNAATADQTLANQQITHGIYELTTAQPLTENAGKILTMNIGTSPVKVEIPLIISGETTVSANGHDVVILNGAKLTAAETSYSYNTIYVYGGGKLAIPEGAQLGVNNIILRAGDVATNDAGQEATYQYIYPQVDLKGTLTATSQTFLKYEYVTDYDHWYHLVLPFNASLNTITYPQEYYGDNVDAKNTGSWVIKRYDGATRATGNYAAWVDIETEEATQVLAGKGYIYWGAPKKVTIGGDTQRQKWGIQRITMNKQAANAKTEENSNKTISDLSSYATVEGNSGAANDQGWNLIGNPYMVNLTTMSEVGLKAGKLVEELVDGKWTGKWINNGDGIRYLTIPSEHFDTYTAKTVVQSMPLVAGRAFFVQLEGEANGITFATANRASLMPALLAENNDKPVDIETGIVLSNETLQDEVNFWIKDGKTNDYEYNADYPKTPNNNRFNIYGVHTNGDLSWVAISPELAAESMPIGYQVPAAGTYMLSLSETYYSEDLESLYVTDHAMSPELTVDLINAPYEFSVNQAETNNERFTISLKFKSENQGPTTGWENIDVGKDHPTKFIHQDRLYILRDGVIYDATGQEIQTINK